MSIPKMSISKEGSRCAENQFEVQFHSVNWKHTCTCAISPVLSDQKKREKCGLI
jgi:hypothetical protein